MNFDSISKLTLLINIDHLLFLGGLAEEVDEKVLHAAFIPFGDVVDVQIPLDYETEKHRGFAFVEFESAEDAAAAIDNMVSMLYKSSVCLNISCVVCSISERCICL